MKAPIREQALIACRRLLSQLNRDPATPTYGCFDRRYWAWKLTDFPEATFQRNAAPLTWYLQQADESEKDRIKTWIKAALLYTTRIQHRDGSFDQAYPYERSYGATAFLLPDLCSAFEAVKDASDEPEILQIERCLTRSADFLCRGSETHEFISNHLAGAALGLLKASYLFQNKTFREKSTSIISSIIQHQSKEGWFPEYGGADPGYQTLCMYYLAQIYINQPNEELHQALELSLDFLQYFSHPDGTFGGEYGSRRTELYYPGGIALLAEEFSAAAALAASMNRAIENGLTTTVLDVDLGNTAPLLSNYILASEAKTPNKTRITLPNNDPKINKFFNSAGIGVFGNNQYYAVYGFSNGGVLKVFRKADGALLFDDGGLLGETVRGNPVSSQTRDPKAEISIVGNTAQAKSRLSFIPTASPNPTNFLLLRLANFTFMRIPAINEWIKKLMVRMLIQKDDFIPVSHTRRIEFSPKKVTIVDLVQKDAGTEIKKLQIGLKFSAIHMASARYFAPAQLSGTHAIKMNCEILNRTGSVTQSIQIDCETGEIIHLL